MGTPKPPAPVAKDPRLAYVQSVQGKTHAGASMKQTLAKEQKAADDELYRRRKGLPSAKPVIATPQTPAPEPTAPTPVAPPAPISDNEVQMDQIGQNVPEAPNTKTIYSSRKVGPQGSMLQARSGKTR